MAKKKEGDLVMPVADLGKPVLREIPVLDKDEDEIVEAMDAVAVDPWALLRDALDALSRVEFKLNRGGVFHVVLHSPDGGTVPFSCAHGGREDLVTRMDAWRAVQGDVVARIDAAL